WKGLQQELMRLLSNSLTRYQLAYQKGRQSFVKRIPGGRLSFHLSFVPHQNDFEVTADFAIRNDAVEQLVHKANTRLSRSELKRTYAIGAEVGNFTDGARKAWPIKSADDIAGAAREILARLSHAHCHTTSATQSHAAMLEVLSRNDDVGRLHCPFDSWRCMKAVALASLSDRSMAQELVGQGERFLTERGDAFGLKLFLAFVGQSLA